MLGTGEEILDFEGTWVSSYVDSLSWRELLVQQFYFRFSVQNVSIFAVSEKTALVCFLNILLTTNKLFADSCLYKRNIHRKIQFYVLAY